MFFFLIVILYFLKIFSLIVLAVLLYGWLLSSSPYKGAVTDHFDGNVFNSHGSEELKRREALEELKERRSVLGWIFRRRKNSWVYQEKSADKNGGARETVQKERVVGSELVVTFINHSTVLIQTESLNILTDPVWSKYASPVSFMGPKRYASPGLALEDLPPIDIILLSHNHYDHLDLATMKKLSKIHKPRIYSHLGNAAYLKKKGIGGVTDLDWGDRRMEVNDVEIHSVPAQHFSARGLADRNKTLWGGFVIHPTSGNKDSEENRDIYFAGDTGYGPFIDRIVSEYPSGFRFGLLPIGAYEPSFMMKEVHMSPDEAVQAFKELKIKQGIGIHFGTFKLANDSQFQPVERLKEIMGDNKSFLALRNGESIILQP